MTYVTMLRNLDIFWAMFFLVLIIRDRNLRHKQPLTTHIEPPIKFCLFVTKHQFFLTTQLTALKKLHIVVLLCLNVQTKKSQFRVQFSFKESILKITISNKLALHTAGVRFCLKWWGYENYCIVEHTMESLYTREQGNVLPVANPLNCSNSLSFIRSCPMHLEWTS